MLNLLVAIQKDVKINVARALVNDLLATHCTLDILQLVEKSQRFEFSFNLHRPISANKTKKETNDRTNSHAFPKGKAKGRKNSKIE